MAAAGAAFAEDRAAIAQAGEAIVADGAIGVTAGGARRGWAQLSSRAQPSLQRRLIMVTATATHIRPIRMAITRPIMRRAIATSTRRHMPTGRLIAAAGPPGPGEQRGNSRK